MSEGTWFVAAAQWPGELAETLNYLADNEENWPWLVAIREVEPKGCELMGYFATPEEADLAIQQLQAAWPENAGPFPEGKFSLTREGEQDWVQTYRAHFQPWALGGIHWVPVWERETYSLPAGEKAIWLDPGMAFGTGNHETTRLCLQELIALRKMLEEKNLWKTGWDCVDAGCGTGILALSAEALGYAPVYGFDNDPVAVRVARENALAQGAPLSSVRWGEGDLINGWPEHPAGMVVANILAVVLIRFAYEVVDAVRPGGFLILSGILSREADEVISAYQGRVRFVRRTDLGEWSALVFQRPVEA